MEKDVVLAPLEKRLRRCRLGQCQKRFKSDDVDALLPPSLPVTDGDNCRGCLDDDQRDERGLPMEMVYWEP